MKEKEIKKIVREGYAEIAKKNQCGCTPVNSCCGGTQAKEISKKIGYTIQEINAVPDGANLGLGCRRPAPPGTPRPEPASRPRSWPASGASAAASTDRRTAPE